MTAWSIGPDVADSRIPAAIQHNGNIRQAHIAARTRRTSVQRQGHVNNIDENIRARSPDIAVVLTR